MATVAEVFAQALQQHRAGDLPQAEQLYRRILQADPSHADTHHWLGVLAYQQGRPDQAVAEIGQAIALNPTVSDYHSNLGVAHEALKQIPQAVAAYQAAVRLQPDAAVAHNNLGNVLQDQGRLQEAVYHCQQALRVRPDFPEAHRHMGDALLRLNKPEHAATHYRAALQYRPDFPDAHCGLGMALASQGKSDEAVLHYRQALELNPNFAAAHNNLAAALVSLGQLDAAVQHCREALRIKPGFPEAYNNLGNALQAQRKVDAAIESYRQVLQLIPDHAEARYNLGNALRMADKLEESIEWFHQALQLKPDFPFAHNNLGNAFLKQGWTDKAVASFQQALLYQPDLAVAQSNLLFCLNCDPQADPQQIFAEHCRWGHLYVPVMPSAPFANEPAPNRVLRIGYVSPDLRRHAVTRYFEPVLAHHDPRAVEVFCYAEVSHADEVTERLQKLARDWCWTCHLTDDQLVERIRGDNIDIVVDLAGHTAGNRLPVFARKPAPVQATWLGYLNTTGLTTMDYRLTDELMDLPGQPVCDTEELFRLPGGMCCFAPDVDAPTVAPLPALRRGFLTFGSLHSLFKLNAAVFDVWSRILQALPTARLLIFRDSVTNAAREHLCRQFAQRGIDAQRLDLRKGTGAAGFLAVYNEVDVALDTFPYTGGVTTCEALWMGVPVVSLRGVRPAGRHSASILSRVGLNDWVADSPDKYVDRAVSKAGDLEQLAALRAGLRGRMTAAMCDAGRFTRDLEDAYRTIWRRWCAMQNRV